MPTLALALFLSLYHGFLRHDDPEDRVRTSRKELVPNSHGFPALPNELYSEILSHLQAIPIPQSAYFTDTTDPRRHVTLLALSQTSKSLRSFFLQYAWERIEVFEGMWTPTGRLAAGDELLLAVNKQELALPAKFTEEIRRQFETVTVRHPHLAQYVHVVNIQFVDSSDKRIMLPQLAKILSLLPHVHTLQICLTPMSVRIRADFSQYPQIQTLCVRGSLSCDDILRACPNLTSFTQYDPGTMLLEPLLRSCSSRLHTLGILSINKPLQALASSFPHLRDITVDYGTLKIHESNLSPLSSLHLHTLRLCVSCRVSKNPVSHRKPTAKGGSHWQRRFLKSVRLVERKSSKSGSSS